MTTKDRIPVFPSRANSVLMKTRILSANKGLSLLKRKRDALELKLREIVAKRAGLAENFEELFSQALFTIAKANFLDTDFKPAPIIGSERADACMRLTYTKTIGLQLPTFEPMIKKPESLPFTGLSHGGKQVDVIRDAFQELLRSIILLASYDYSIRILNESIRANNMRLNGLEYVVIPRLANTAAYIFQELDELEREEFYRLKRSQRNQRALRQKGKTIQKASNVPTKADAETWTGDELEEKFVPLPLSIYMSKKSASAAQTIITGHFPGSQEFISPNDSIVSGIIPMIRKHLPTNFMKKERPAENVALDQTSSGVDSDSKPAKRVSVLEQGTPYATPFSSNESSAAPSTTGQVPLTDKKGNKAPPNTEDTDYPESLTPFVSSSLASAPQDTSLGTASAIIDSQKLGEPTSSKDSSPLIYEKEVSVQTDIAGRFPRRSEMLEPLLNGIASAEVAESQTNVQNRRGRASMTEVPDHGNSSESEHEGNIK